jgi:hypothetical protein
MIESEAYSAKAARAGKDIGKKGKNFDKIAKKAAERYGSEERGKKVAGAILKKLRMKEEAEQLGEKAPPGKKFERMVKHIKKGYESGGLTKQEKGIAYATAWKSYNKEEVEQVSELSTELLGRYKKAAVDSYREADKRGDVAKTNKRFKGTITATNKQFANDLKKRASKQNEEKEASKLPPHLQKLIKDKNLDKVFMKTVPPKHTVKDVTPKGYGPTEEVELDEAIPKSTSIALVHTASKKIVAKGNKNQMMKKMKELNSKEKGSHHLGSTYRGKVGDTFGEEVEQVSEKFSDAQIAALRTAYSKISSIDPDSNSYKQLLSKLDSMDKATLTKVANGNIKFMSGLARNRLNRMKNEDTSMSIKFTEFRSRLDEASYMGKGNHKPGWMLRADPKLAAKFKEIEDRKKRMNSLMKTYGGKTGDEIAKMKKEEIEQVNELEKSTLGSYIKKASHDVATKSALTRHFATKSRDEKEKQNYTQARKDDETSNKLFNKSWKRRQGIAKAVDRLTKKEVEIS